MTTDQSETCWPFPEGSAAFGWLERGPPVDVAPEWTAPPPPPEPPPRHPLIVALLRPPRTPSLVLVAAGMALSALAAAAILSALLMLGMGLAVAGIAATNHVLGGL